MNEIAQCPLPVSINGNFSEEEVQSSTDKTDAFNASRSFVSQTRWRTGGRGLGPWWQSGGGRSQVCVTWVLCVGADVRGAGTAAPKG